MNGTEDLVKSIISVLEVSLPLFDEKTKKDAENLIKEGKVSISLNHLYAKLSQANMFTSIDITDDEFEAIDYYSTMRLDEMNKDLDGEDPKAVEIMTKIRRKMLPYASSSRQGGFKLTAFEVLFLQMQIDKYMRTEITRLAAQLGLDGFLGGGE